MEFSENGVDPEGSIQVPQAQEKKSLHDYFS